MSTLLSDKNIFNYVFDGGCGTGVCSIALASRAKNVVAFDLSAKSLMSAKSLAEKKGQKT
ncbi:MAG: hypothetical protein CMI55_02355 [Parcubacteria group bacterium]|nr:hypothetical protein [Parcubacteria group bacterium]